MTLSEDDALAAYARMLNSSAPDAFLSLLAEDFVYTSHWVFKDITSAGEFAAYIREKLDVVRTSGATVYAELGRVHDPFRGEERACVVLAQGGRDELAGLAFADVAGGRVTRVSLQIVPGVHTAQRSGVYPT